VGVVCAFANGNGPKNVLVIVRQSYCIFDYEIIPRGNLIAT